MTDEIETFERGIDVMRLLAPAYQSVIESKELVHFCMASMETADLTTPPKFDNGDVEYKFPAPERSADQRRAMYQAWIAARALQEIVRGIMVTLQEVLFVIELMKLNGTVTDENTNTNLAKTRKTINSYRHPQLLTKINQALKSPLEFEVEMTSLNAVRNCLEHRAGVVGGGDVNSDEHLVLTFPKFAMIANIGGNEVEVGPGDQLHHGDMFLGPRLIHVERKYARGQQIVIDAKMFDEIAFGCTFFLQDIGQKMLEAFAGPAEAAPAAA